jgi:hypothetical protein
VVVSTNGRLAQLLPPQLELLPYPPKINLRAKLAKHGGTFGRCLHKMLCLSMTPEVSELTAEVRAYERGSSNVGGRHPVLLRPSVAGLPI